MGNTGTILPLVVVKSKLFGSKVISSAYLEYGGFAGAVEGVQEILAYLQEKYASFDYLEIRGGLEKFEGVLSSQLVKKNLYKRFVLDLSKGEKEVWAGIQHSKRKAITRALKNLEVKEVQLSELNSFYDLYCRNMRDFGSPCYSKQYFISFYEKMVSKGLGKIFGSYHQGKLVSALLGFCYNERVHILIAVSDEKFYDLRPNDAMHWKFIQWACQDGYTTFDFGRVREESGQFEYKQKWGPQLLELPSYFQLWQVKEIPLVDPSSSKYKLALKVWRRMPLFVTKLIGMKLRKGLGI